MPRGRPRKQLDNLPPHIDAAKVPAGLYWDPSGNGRWYVRKPEYKVLAHGDATLATLHAMMEDRDAGPAKGTIAYVLDAFHDELQSREFKNLSARTKKDYAGYKKAICAYPAKGGKFGDLHVDHLGTPVFRRLFNIIALGKPAERDREAVPPYPSKANHWLRYLRRGFGWGVQYGKCKTNPCQGIDTVEEVADPRMPELTVFRAVQEFARARSHLKPREKGCLPPYLWAAMELGYQARLRGIEVLTLTDAHDLADEDRLRTNRRKGSRDNRVRKGSLTQAAIDALRAYRQDIFDRQRDKGRPVITPLRPEHRPLFVNEDGEQLTRSGFNTAWGRLMRAAIEAKVITGEQRFGLHGLKHRGITDSEDKASGGHKSESMRQRYDHEIPAVEPANDA